jgi:hypothetical protein
MVSVIYKGRALPLLWITRKGKKGHFPENMHIDLIQAVQEIIPKLQQSLSWVTGNLMEGSG